MVGRKMGHFEPKINPGFTSSTFFHAKCCQILCQILLKLLPKLYSQVQNVFWTQPLGLSQTLISFVSFVNEIFCPAQISLLLEIDSCSIECLSVECHSPYSISYWMFKWQRFALVFFAKRREYYRGKYHCAMDLLFDWFGIFCMTIDNFCFYLQNRLIQTSQTGGQRYSDTSPFIPC